MAKAKIGKSVFFLMVGVVLPLLSGCFWSSSSKKKNSNFYLVNVLDKQFFDDCRIDGSINVSLSCLI